MTEPKSVKPVEPVTLLVPFKRRVLLQGVAACFATGFIACKSDEPPAKCEGEVSEMDKRMRDALEYIDLGPDPTKHCVSCLQYIAPPSPTSCGTCKLVKGPIHPKGTCKVFALNPAAPPAAG